MLRKGADTFAGKDDPEALVVYEGDDRVIVDAEFLTNELKVFYRPYYFDGVAWSEGPTNHGTPSATYADHSTDVQSFVRDRMERGLLVEVRRGTLTHELGYVQVFTAPPSLEQNLRLPVVTIQLDDESSGIRGIGENISGDEFDSVGFEWDESEGWLANVQLSLVGWCLNSDERIELRKAIRRIIASNLPVLQSRGIDQVNLTMRDEDAVNGEYGAPIYQVVCTMSCVAPVRVSERIKPIEDVIMQIQETPTP